MQPGHTFDGEYRTFNDAQTGAVIHQLTDDQSINHSLFFLNPSFRPGNNDQVTFITERFGSPQLCLFDFADETARVLTDVEGLQPFSPKFSLDGQLLYFTTSTGKVMQVDVDSRETSTLAEQPGANLGEAALSHDGKYIVSAMKGTGKFGLMVTDVAARTSKVILETDLQIIHPQFHPTDSNLIEYAGHPTPRLWLISRDGSNNHCPYENEWNEFIVHESFLGKSDDLIFAIWPKRLGKFNIKTKELSTIVELNAWHMVSNRDGSLIVSDTSHPDRGLLLIDPTTGTYNMLCQPGASCHGSQWQHDHPATPDAWKKQPSEDADPRVLSWMEMKVDTVYGPQWTHPHPAFNDDGSRVVYTSDASGHPQVYIVEIGKEHLPADA